MNEQKVMGRRKAILFMILIGVAAFAIGSLWEGDDYYEEISDGSEQAGDDCNVVAFSINGYLSTFMVKQPADEEYDISSSEDIVYGLLTAENDNQTKAIMVLIDSGGGDGVAGEEIANALKSLSKPNIAVIRGMGASAAYWAASGADKIYASKISDVGSLGLTQSYLDQSGKDAEEGYKYIELTSAKYKDLGNPSRPITDEERAILIADLEKAHDVLVEEVAKNRNLKQDDVAKLANGLTFIGLDALKLGLIDEIGDIVAATEYIEELIGEKAEICWY